MLVVNYFSAPTHFICVRVNRDDVAYSGNQFIDKLGNAYYSDVQYELFMKAAYPPSKYHVTLCVCRLETDKEIERVKQVYNCNFLVLYFLITGNFFVYHFITIAAYQF